MDKEIADVEMNTITDGPSSNNDQQLMTINNQLNLYLRYKFLKNQKIFGQLQEVVFENDYQTVPS